MITEQGEGASPCNPLQVDVEKDKHLSHYYAFSSIVNKRYVKKINLSNITVGANHTAEDNKVMRKVDVFFVAMFELIRPMKCRNEISNPMMLVDLKILRKLSVLYNNVSVANTCKQDN